MPGSVLLAGALGALGLAIAMLVVALLPARPGNSGVSGALAAIERRYAQGSSAASEKPADPLGAVPGWMRAVALRLSPSGFAAKLQHRLDIAGNPERWNPDRVLAAKGSGLVVLAAIGMLIGAHKPVLLILCAGVGGGVGFFLPDVLLYNSGVKRQARIRSALPDAMDMLTVCVEAGLGFDAALAQVARNTGGPLAAELARVLQEMQIGKSRTEALHAMSDRTTVIELRAFVSSLVQASELGISVAQVLREQAKELRLRRRQRAEEQAQKVSVKIMFPLITCLFPALFVVVIGPGVITIIHSLSHR
ncbi:MAG: type II secretion system F family protein [Actinobacteria bacterium]|nr:type II secretion system F family protein [Actinomycetota bacterium]